MPIGKDSRLLDVYTVTCVMRFIGDRVCVSSSRLSRQVADIVVKQSGRQEVAAFR